ncbi:MAG: radical SAM family heme chaperone HemW [Puniceicoccales bacterium]|jgi:oxygen-independent coproporphyrinogen-3 oxidase|nr:radical SAM family heme chaperone HemW [Puniceicoccales bacterium]
MQAQAVGRTPLGLYLHVPFCAHRCDYCAFYREEPRRSAIELYLWGIRRSLEDLALTRPPDTIYWGGGTPGVLTPNDLLLIGNAIQALPFYSPPMEWTVELAPNTVRVEKLLALRGLGVNRLSMGVQSFFPKTLRRLGRRQNPEQVFRAYDALRHCGFGNLGLDLIFAIPDQTLTEWEEDLRAAIRLRPEHISTYNLSLEGDAKMNRSAGPPTEAALERERDFYRLTVEFLESAGYRQYEVSNFCLPGRESRHNLHTWRMADWIGLGPSASSQYDRRRYTQYPSLRRWAQALREGTPSFTLEKVLDERILFTDSCIFGLRLKEGIDLGLLQRRLGPAFDASGIGPAARAARGEKGPRPFSPRAKPAPNTSSPSRTPLVGSMSLAPLEGFFQTLIDAGYMCSPASSR